MPNISKRNGLLVFSDDRNDCSIWKPCCCENGDDPGPDPDPEPGECPDTCPEPVLDSPQTHNGVDNDPVIDFDIMVEGSASASTATVSGESGVTASAEYSSVTANAYPQFDFVPDTPANEGDKLGEVHVATATEHKLAFLVAALDEGEAAGSVAVSFSEPPTAVQNGAVDNGDGTYSIFAPTMFGEDPFEFDCVESVTVSVLADSDNTVEASIKISFYDAVVCE